MIWSCIPLLRSLQIGQPSTTLKESLRNHDCRTVYSLDFRGSDEDAVGRDLTQWIENGGPGILRMHAIPDLLAEHGPQRILQQTAEILERMPVWGIARPFRNAVLRALETHQN